ncbi:MAG: 6-carboxytetrahydropterin synthase [Deltaproteobacteria bacterium]|nr:6-carboxytetrahydropterin synthase [Deltaproteobacteria bacterium]
MFQICKTIYFCYGHRLMGHEGGCGHLHGHNARVEILLKSETLDQRDFVFDFGEITAKVKTWIDQEMDHKMLLRKDDPLIGPLRELGEPVVVFEANPSAEAIARKIYRYAVQKELPVEEVKVWETESAWASYRGE